MRDASAAFAAEAGRVTGAYEVFFLEADFGGDNGTFRAYSGIGNRAWQAVTWYATGDLLSVGEITEGADRRANGLKAELASTGDFQAQDHFRELLERPWSGGRCRLWRGWIDAAGALVADPIVAFDGRLDDASLEEAEDGTARILVQAEQELDDLDRSSRYRMNAASQKSFDPADRFFEFQSQLDQMKFTWGKLWYSRQKED